MSSSTTSTATDHQTQQRVQDELRWTPEVASAGIGVAVTDGTVTLSGEVADMPERHAVTQAAFRISGVTTVVDELTVHPDSPLWATTETDIARDVSVALTPYRTLPGSVRASIVHHTVTLTGEVQWNYQRDNARRAVEHVAGVALVVNSITLHPRVSATDTDEHIRRALVRTATLEAGGVHVAVADTTVTLTGQVRSFVERVQVENAAWSSPHVTAVQNNLTVAG